MANDRDDLDAGFEEVPVSPGDNRRKALGMVKAPAIGLIVAAVLSFFISIWGLYSATVTFDKSWDETIAKMKKDVEGKPQQQQDATAPIIKLFEDYRVPFKYYSTATNAISFVLSIVMIVGGLRMKNLQSRGLAMASAIVAVIPCFQACCLITLPFGIWAIIVLNRKEVKQSFR